MLMMNEQPSPSPQPHKKRPLKILAPINLEPNSRATLPADSEEEEKEVDNEVSQRETLSEHKKEKVSG